MHARIYIRVSTDKQSTKRQEEQLTANAKAAGIDGFTIYREKASGARADRPELQRMISDLQPGEIVIAEKIDRISRLPLEQAKQLIKSIQEAGAKFVVPGIVDLSSVIEQTDNDLASAVLKATQQMLLDIALQMARDDYETRRERQKQGIAIAKRERKYTGRKVTKEGEKVHKLIIELRTKNMSIADTAKLCGCGTTLVKNVWKAHKAAA